MKNIVKQLLQLEPNNIQKTPELNTQWWMYPHWLNEKQWKCNYRIVESTNRRLFYFIFSLSEKILIQFSKYIQMYIPVQEHNFGFGFVFMLNATFNHNSVISWRSVLLVEETKRTLRNPKTCCNSLTSLSHNVVSSTPRHERGSNSQP